MGNIQKFIDGSVVSIFGGWLVATLLSQHPESNLDRFRRLDDRFGNAVIPNWKFFAPNPAVEDVHILYRLASADLSEYSPWMECHTISPRKMSQAFWFPRRRFEKGIFDAHQTLVMGLASMGKGEENDTALREAIGDTSEMLNNYIRYNYTHSISETKEDWYWQQLMLVRFAGNDDAAKPIYDLILNYRAINKNRALDISPIFSCDSYFNENYDEVMRAVDPDADHAEWIARTVGQRLPQRILDIGAGTGRVLTQVASRFPNAKLFAIEPNEKFAQSLAGIDVDFFPGTVEEAFAKTATTDIDLAFVTYGSLQYISNLDELAESLKAVRRIMAPGGVVAVELFASEIYHAPVQPSPMSLRLDEELHTIGMSSLQYPDGMVEITTQIKRQSDGKTGVMKECVLPVTRQEAAEAVRTAGFSSVEIKLKGAYLRCTAKNMKL